jgi:hypothetical protein
MQDLGWFNARTKRAARGGDWSTTDEGIDIVATDPFKIQCKRYKGYSPISKIEEVECNRDLGEIPMLITKADHKESMCVLPWSDMKDLLRWAFPPQ